MPELRVEISEEMVPFPWWRIGVALAAAGQGMAFGLGANLTPPEGVAYWIVHGGLIFSAVVVLALLGGPMFAESWRAIRDRKLPVDLLFLLTLLGALAGSLVATFTRQGAVYYEVVGILMVVYTAGKMLTARQRAAALRSATSLREQFEHCMVRTPEGLRRMAVNDLAPDDLVDVSAGGAISVDGTVEEGEGWVVETALTGEWLPAFKEPGNAVLAGTYSRDAALVVRPRPGPRRLDAVLSILGAARQRPSRLQVQADRIAAVFIPIVAAVAAATLIFWWPRTGWTDAVLNSMAVLLVACPCALGLATPLAVWGGLAAFARSGLVARHPDLIDALARTDAVVFDKTGTLSGDRARVERVEWMNGDGDATRAMPAVRALTAGDSHPAARAVADWAGDGPTISLRRKAVPGRGIEGDGEAGLWRFGSEPFAGTAPRSESAAKAVGLSRNGEPVARFFLREEWRDGLEETVAELTRLGLRQRVMTGDPASPDSVAGLSVERGLDPLEKQARVRAWAEEGRHVVFVGDGINDAAAMTTADAGIAMAGGADLARSTAAGVFMGNDFRFLPRAIRLARSAREGIRRNMRFALVYNVVGMGLAAAGKLHPVVAALLMVGASATVAALAWRSTAAPATPPSKGRGVRKRDE